MPPPPPTPPPVCPAGNEKLHLHEWLAAVRVPNTSSSSRGPPGNALPRPLQAGPHQAARKSGGGEEPVGGLL